MGPNLSKHRSRGVLRSWIRRALGAAAFASLTLATLEGTLQLAPRLVPLVLLQQFSPELRREIAESRGLHTRAKSRFISRYDGGPPLHLPVPGMVDAAAATDAGMSTGVRLDEDGFCNPASPPAAGEGTPRPVELVTIGDSFTYCTTVRAEEAWTAALAARLGISARNLGAIGKGPLEYLQVLRTFGLPSHPRIVVLAYYGGNDVRDMLEVLEFRALTQQPAPETSAPDPAAERAGPRGFLLAAIDRYSRAYNLIRAIPRAWRAPDPSQSLVRLAGARKASFDYRYEIRLGDGVVEMNPENADRDELLSARAFARGAISLEPLNEPLLKLAALAREHGFVPIVAYIPSAHIAYAESVRFSDPSLAEPLAAFDEAQRAFLRRQVAALGMRFVDTTLALRAGATSAGALLYFPTNLHLSPAGHLAVADALEPALREVLGGVETR